MLKVDGEAIEDLRYLLGRGYRRASAVRFVADRFALDNAQRLLLFRCVYPPETAREHLEKLVSADALRNLTLSVDGLNVLWTVDGALKGRPLFLCDDGFVRDVSISRGPESPEALSEAAGHTMTALARLLPRYTSFVLDRPISRSGEISSLLRSMMMSNAIKGDSNTSSQTDSEVLRAGEVVATSDSVIIEKASMVFDLASFVIESQLGSRPTKFK